MAGVALGCPSSLSTGTVFAIWLAMRIAIPVWQGRISPVFDVAGRLLLVELVDGLEISRWEHRLPDTEPQPRIALLLELQVHTLICGAISQPLEALLIENGIRVYSRVCGDVDDVLNAFVAGTVSDPRYAMPGCCGQMRRYRCGGCGRERWSSDA
jgi:predicted Fe-Mo cluster-binding NifX family protein